MASIRESLDLGSNDVQMRDELITNSDSPYHERYRLYIRRAVVKFMNRRAPILLQQENAFLDTLVELIWWIVFREFPTYSGSNASGKAAKLSTWMHPIIVRTTQAEIERVQAPDGTISLETFRDIIQLDAILEEQHPGQFLRSNPESIVAESESFREIYELLLLKAKAGKHAERDCQILHLAIIDEIPIKDIAHQLHLDEATGTGIISSVIHRVTHRLRSQLCPSEDAMRSWCAGRKTETRDLDILHMAMNHRMRPEAIASRLGISASVVHVVISNIRHDLLRADHQHDAADPA
jgi:hypothetical protein